MTRLLFWTPRVLAILLILLLTLFSLDVFEIGGGIGAVLLGLLMHNLWTIALTVILVFAWRRDLVGAIGFLAFGLVILALQLARRMLPEFGGVILLTGVPLLIGLLFLAGWLTARKTGQ